MKLEEKFDENSENDALSEGRNNEFDNNLNRIDEAKSSLELDKFSRVTTPPRTPFLGSRNIKKMASDI